MSPPAALAEGAIAPRLLAAAALVAAAGVCGAACPPHEADRAALERLRAEGWALADDGRRQTLAIVLVDCLAAPDPVLRDDLAFAAISRWSRQRLLTPATLQTIRAALLSRLAPGHPDPSGVERPFAALALAEVARADRLQPFLSSDERSGLLAAATAYLRGVDDLRGFDARDGWRHGVAHGADLLLQLSLHPALARSDLDAILAAVATQVMPPGHFYIYGEGERLMAPVFYVGRRDALTADEWSAWFAALASARPRPAAPTQASLAARHDLALFLLPLYASVREHGSEQMRARMLPGLTAALATLD